MGYTRIPNLFRKRITAQRVRIIVPSMITVKTEFTNKILMAECKQPTLRISLRPKKFSISLLQLLNFTDKSLILQ